MSTVNSEANQRSLPRSPAAEFVWVQCRRSSGTTNSIATGLLDISAGGLQLLAKEPLYPWETVDIVLGCGASPTPIKRRGEVRWVLSLSGEACCAGVRFLEPLREDELRLLTEFESSAADGPAFPW